MTFWRKVNDFLQESRRVFNENDNENENINDNENDNEN